MKTEYIDVCTANTYKNSIYDCKVELKKIFAIFYYKKNGDDGAFERAAQTTANEINKSNSYSKDRGDLILIWSVFTAAEFKDKWSKLNESQKNSLYRVEELHLFTHASIGERIDGLEFSASFTNTGALIEDGTVSPAELLELPKLQWTKNSHIVFYGCNTGKINSTYGQNKSIAKILHDSQKPSKTSAQEGYSYFSIDKNTYVKAIGSPNVLFLWAFKRGKNSWVGNGEALPPVIIK